MASLAVTIERNLRGSVTAVGTPDLPGRFARYRLNADGSLASETLGGGGQARRYGYDAIGRLTLLDDPAFGVTLSYRCEGAPAYGDGRVIHESTAWKASAFAARAPADIARLYRYDAFGRLTMTARDARQAPDLLHRYDPNGNILARASRDAPASLYRYEPGSDRLGGIEPADGASSLAVGHDADGALRRLGATTLRHDGPGHRASGVRTPSAALAYQVDAAGERVLKRVRPSSSASSAIAGSPIALQRLTVRSGSSALVEIGSDGSREAYIYGPTGLLALRTGGADHPVSKDHRGSVRAVWNGTGTVAVQFDFLPFGALDIGNSHIADGLAARIRRRYTGQEWEEETGFYAYHARLYDPALARFLSPDPARDGPCPYAYAGNDPVDFTDPTGLIITKFAQYFDRLLFLNERSSIIRNIEYVEGEIYTIDGRQYSGWEYVFRNHLRKFNKSNNVMREILNIGIYSPKGNEVYIEKGVSIVDLQNRFKSMFNARIITDDYLEERNDPDLIEEILQGEGQYNEVDTRNPRYPKSVFDLQGINMRVYRSNPSRALRDFKGQIPPHVKVDETYLAGWQRRRDILAAEESAKRPRVEEPGLTVPAPKRRKTYAVGEWPQHPELDRPPPPGGASDASFGWRSLS